MADQWSKGWGEAQSEDISNHDKILESQGQDIARLENEVMKLRNKAIKAEVRSGRPTKEVADEYNLSSARVSQLAPRKQ